MRWALLVDDIRMTRSLLEQGYGHDDLRHCNGPVNSYVYDGAPMRSRTSQISSWRSGIDALCGRQRLSSGTVRFQSRVGCGAARIARLVSGGGQGPCDS